MIPNVRVVEVNKSERMLILEHEWEGKELQIKYAHETLHYIAVYGAQSEAAHQSAQYRSGFGKRSLMVIFPQTFHLVPGSSIINFEITSGCNIAEGKGELICAAETKWK
jgi:hypothetical protein